MYKKLIISAALLFSTKIWTLSCTAPITISDPRLDASNAHVFANEKGDAAIIWVSTQAKKEASTISYKKQNSAWSSPEFLGGWEESIYANRCFIKPNGNILAIWRLERGDRHRFEFTEKKEGNSWTSPVNVDEIPSHPNSSLTGIELDPFGKLVFFGETSTTYTTKPTYPGGYTYEKTIPGIALIIQGHSEKWDTFTLDEDTYTISDLSITLNKNEMGYASWISYKYADKVLMGRKIQNGRFILEPKVICHATEYVNHLRIVSNEKGDSVIVYLEGDYAKIITNFEDSWSEPFTFIPKEEDPFLLEVSIDNDGNIMAVCGVTINEVDLVKAIYKPFGQPWMNSVLFSHPDATNWHPEIKPDGKGNFVMIWQQEIRNRNAIFGASFSTTKQTWSDPQLLSPKGESCYGYSYTFGAPGQGYISWTTSPNGFDESVQVAELSN